MFYDQASQERCKARTEKTRREKAEALLSQQSGEAMAAIESILVQFSVTTCLLRLCELLEGTNRLRQFVQSNPNPPEIRKTIIRGGKLFLVAMIDPSNRRFVRTDDHFMVVNVADDGLVTEAAVVTVAQSHGNGTFFEVTQILNDSAMAVLHIAAENSDGRAPDGYKLRPQLDTNLFGTHDLNAAREVVLLALDVVKKSMGV